MLKNQEIPQAFSEANLQSVLQKKFELKNFRIGQLEIIQDVLSGKDVVAILPTGGGKSLCYQLPAVIKNQLVVVISPLIALMNDQAHHLAKMGIPSGAIHSGRTLDEKKLIFSELQKNGPFILFVSPERAQKEGFKNWLLLQKIALLAIDEAHCISQWGHDFRESYSQLSYLKELRPDVPILALTASATPPVRLDIARQLKLKTPEKHVHGFYRSNLYYQVEECEDEEIKNIFLQKALIKHPEGRILVYCGTRKMTEELSQRYSRKFKAIGFYHAGLATPLRNEIQKSYTEGRIRILFATNAFGMGIDQPNVRAVIHYSIPADLDSLYQEMGRGGRDGLPATCLLLYARKDKGLQAHFISASEAPKEIINLRWRNLESLIEYAGGANCRHSEILDYFRDSKRIKKCGHCDNCAPNSALRIKY
jgi:ATP-dependent DNA helicase RecQ